MKYATISALCEGVAGAIRAKEGSTEKINPQDFVQRIENLQVGGTSESSIEYLDVRDNTMTVDIIAGGIVEMKVAIENAPIPIEELVGGGMAVFPMVDSLRNMGATVNFIAVSFNRDAVLTMKQDGAVITQTAYEQLASRGETYVEAYNNLPRLTKEQFYTLE